MSGFGQHSAEPAAAFAGRARGVVLLGDPIVVQTDPALERPPARDLSPNTALFVSGGSQPIASSNSAHEDSNKAVLGVPLRDSEGRNIAG